MKHVVLAFFFATTFGHSATAQIYRTGADLLPACKDLVANRETPAGVYCLATVIATRNLAQYLMDSMKSCPPAKTPNGEVVQLVTKYMDDHPERLREPHQAVILLALQDAYPCQK
jgi:hypothetical protein